MPHQVCSLTQKLLVIEFLATFLCVSLAVALLCEGFAVFSVTWICNIFRPCNLINKGSGRLAVLRWHVCACMLVCNRIQLVVTRMDTPKPGWTPYFVYTTEILSFLHNRNITSNGKRSLKSQSSVRLERGSFAS